MAGSKRTYMDLHGHATLQDVIQKYLLDIEDENIPSIQTAYKVAKLIE